MTLFCKNSIIKQKSKEMDDGVSFNYRVIYNISVKLICSKSSKARKIENK